MICGIVLLDKPLGLSSSGATQRVRRLLSGIKAGHVGSLDPLATGMLPICLGEATKLAGEILEGRKIYRFILRLGTRTATGDAEGEIIEQAPAGVVTAAALDSACSGLLGEIVQVPPMYSAIKQGGQPLYRLARAGKTVERSPRTIRIDSLVPLSLGPQDIEMRVVCSKGTYVRVLAEDLAVRLGTVGHVAQLRRESVEPFDPAAMITLDHLAAEVTAGTVLPVIPADQAVAHLAAVALDAGATRRLLHGQPVHAPTADGPVRAVDTTLRLYGADTTFLGLGLAAAGNWVNPKRLFVLVGPQGSE